MGTEDRAPTADHQKANEWFHGSPTRLENLRAGSTITPVRELAEALAHKPSNVSISVKTENGATQFIAEHDGRLNGYLYRVLVDDPEADLRPHPESAGTPFEEMFITRDLPVELVERLTLDDEETVGTRDS